MPFYLVPEVVVHAADGTQVIGVTEQEVMLSFRSSIVIGQPRLGEACRTGRFGRNGSMSPRTAPSAGILLHRLDHGERQVLLIHPGGPFWQRRDVGAWQIPKGRVEAGEETLAAALREFAEELGSAAEGTPVPLGTIRQSGGKQVIAFALAGDLDADGIVSIGFEIEWPPGSGRRQTFPEVDRAAWFTLPRAREMMLPSQLPLLDRLEALVAAGGATPGSA